VLEFQEVPLEVTEIIITEPMVLAQPALTYTGK
jgi:hypothetical protein